MTIWDDDRALDLVSRLMDSADATALLKAALHSGERAEVVAAAEIVAAGRGKPALDVPEEVREMVALYLVYVDDDVVHLALQALERVGGAEEGLTARLRRVVGAGGPV